MTAVDAVNMVLKRMKEIKLSTSYKNRDFVNHSGSVIAKTNIMTDLNCLFFF